MKLLYCPICGDAIRLVDFKWRMCDCGMSGGQYNADLMTATIGGAARVFGVGNPFFNEQWVFLTDEGREAIRNKYGYSQMDCWWGEYTGDLQIFRISEPTGPRLTVTFERLPMEPEPGKLIERHFQNVVTITDTRTHTVDGKYGVSRVIVPGNPKPSFRHIKRRRSK